MTTDDEQISVTFERTQAAVVSVNTVNLEVQSTAIVGTTLEDATGENQMVKTTLENVQTTAETATTANSQKDNTTLEDVDISTESGFENDNTTSEFDNFTELFNFTLDGDITSTDVTASNFELERGDDITSLELASVTSSADVGNTTLNDTTFEPKACIGQAQSGRSEDTSTSKSVALQCVLTRAILRIKMHLHVLLKFMLF